MYHFDDIELFAKKYRKEEIEKQASPEEKFLIENQISQICKGYQIPEWEYRRYLRGHYKNISEFIIIICNLLKCENAEIMIQYPEYTLKYFEKKPDAEFIKICEEHGLENMDDLFVKAKVNTIDIMLTAQKNIRTNLRSKNITVQMKTTELVARMLGNQMLTPNLRKEESEEENEPSSNDAQTSDNRIEDIETTDNETKNNIAIEVTFSTTSNDQ